MSVHSKNTKANDEKLEKLKQMEDRYRSLFSSPVGQIVLEDLKKSLHFGKTLFHEGQPNSDLHFHLGRQSVINGIVEIISRDK